MKRILSILLLLAFYISNSQELPLLTEDPFSSKKISKTSTFKSLVEKGTIFFNDKDTKKKGSGLKPFKRWEYRWSHYLQDDGTIAPSEHLWLAWQKKNTLEKSSKVISNWSAIGPFDQTSKSGQGRINTVAVDPTSENTIYAGAPAGGLWKSIDAGVTWVPLTDNLPQIGVSGIAIDKNNPNIIYISTGDDDGGDSYAIGVLKSLDGGQTWQSTGSLLGNPTSSNEIVIDPNNSNKIWVATSNGLFLSTNAGNSWSQKLSGHIKDFKLKPNNSNTIYAVSSNRFYRSINGGDSFQTTSNGLPSVSVLGTLRVEITPANENKVFVVAGKSSSQNWAFEGMYVSNDSGVSFSKTAETSNIFESNQAWFDLALCASPTDENTLYVGVLNIWKSTDGGQNFTKINDWRNINSKYTHADIHFLRFYNNKLYAGTDGGVYKSDDQGGSFIDLTETMGISQFYRIAVAKQTSNKLAGGLQDNGGFSLLNNMWNNYHGGDGMDTASDPNDENTFYGFSQFGENLTVTNNGGINSSFITTGPTLGNWVTPLVATKSSDLYAGYDQIYQLVENNWKQVSNFNFEGNLETLEIDPSNNDNIYASRGMNLYISNDRGKTFTSRSQTQTGLSGVNISSIEVHNRDSNNIWVTTTGVNNILGPSSGHTGGGVFESSDGGLTFTNITSGLPNESKFVVRHHPFSTNNAIYVGTALGVYHRNDDTNSWEVFSTNLPNVAISDIEINPYDNTITAATFGRSVWQSSIPSVNLPQNDIDLIKIDSKSNFSCQNLAPSVLVTNNGQNTITSLSLIYNIDNGVDQTISWTGTINSNETKEINLPTFTSLSEGDHIITAEVQLIDDENNYNNSNQAVFTVNKEGETQYINTFGDVNEDIWATSNTLWEIGQPTTSTFNGIVQSGYVTNVDGNYTDRTIAYLISPCYDLAPLEDPVLKFKMAFDIENEWDVLYMQYSTNGGQTWEVLGSADDPNWYNSSFKNTNRPLTIGKQWTGKNAILTEYSYDLTELTNEPSIMFRFVFASDASINGEGVVIDDFEIDASAVLSVQELEPTSFTIYPNPSEGVFTISRTNYFSSAMQLQVFDVTGKLVKQTKNITSNTYKLDLSTASKGFYFVKINAQNKVLTKKIIVH